MVDVIDVKTLKEGVSVCRELIMIKIRANAEERQAILSVVDSFQGEGRGCRHGFDDYRIDRKSIKIGCVHPTGQ